MPKFPGELTPDEQEHWIARFREMAEQQFGEAHAAEIESALRSTALAVGAVLKLDFVHDEQPGFYMAPRFDEAAGEWKVN